MNASFAIAGATLIDGTGRPALADALVLVEDSRIAAVGNRASLPLPPEARVIDASGKYLLPGLIDCHVHLAAPDFMPHPVKGDTRAYLAIIAFHNLRSALQAGITTIRSVCDGDHLDLALRSALREGLVLGPRLLSAGIGICMTGGHGSQGSDRTPGSVGIHEVDGPGEVRKAVRQEVKAGADLIKLLTSHRSDHPEFSQEELNAGVDEAHRLGRRVAVHAGNFACTRMAALAGADTIEHGNFLDDETAEIMAAKGICLVPTAWVYHHMADLCRSLREKGMTGGEYPMDQEEFDSTQTWADRVVARYPETLRIARKHGVTIAAGTDNVFADQPFAVLHEELSRLNQLGFSTLEVIRIATHNGAVALGIQASAGTIEPGKAADLILVDRDPIQDITALGEVGWVMREGIELTFSPEWRRKPVGARALFS